MMNAHIRKWNRIFRQRSSPAAAEKLSRQLVQRYTQLLSAQEALPNRHLQTQWEQLIAPGLALYQTLLAERRYDHQAVLDEVEALFKAPFFGTERRMVRLLNLLPDPFPLVRAALRGMTTNHYTPGASEIVEDSRECFAANTTRCFILDTLTRYNAAELTPLFCKTDDWLAAEIPKVVWLRTQTLADGADFCDFRWCRKKRQDS